MEKKIKFSIFYNYNALGDVLILSKNLDAKYSYHVKKGNVAALYDKDNNLYGYNIFDINKWMKIYYKGLLSYPFDYIVNLINIILSNEGFEKLPPYNFSGVRIGKIIDFDNNGYTVSFGEESVYVTSKDTSLNIGDLILYGYSGVLLPSLRRISKEDGEILKENDLFVDGEVKFILMQDEQLVGKDFYKGELKNGN